MEEGHTFTFLWQATKWVTSAWGPKN